MLVNRLKIDQNLAERTYQLLIDPAFGFFPDAQFNLEGFRNMLALRAEIENKGGTAPPPDKYIDLSYYQRALASLKQ
jgi:hypothetical protein